MWWKQGYGMIAAVHPSYHQVACLSGQCKRPVVLKSFWSQLTKGFVKLVAKLGLVNDFKCWKQPNFDRPRCLKSCPHFGMHSFSATSNVFVVLKAHFWCSLTLWNQCSSHQLIFFILFRSTTGWSIWPSLQWRYHTTYLRYNFNDCSHPPWLYKVLWSCQPPYRRYNYGPHHKQNQKCQQ